MPTGCSEPVDRAPRSATPNDCTFEYLPGLNGLEQACHRCPRRVREHRLAPEDEGEGGARARAATKRGESGVQEAAFSTDTTSPRGHANVHVAVQSRSRPPELAGLTPGDQYWMWVNQTNHLVDRWAYCLPS